MKKSQIISLFAAAAFAVVVPSAAFALDAGACGDQVPDALEQKAVDSANSADWFEGGAPSDISAATPSQSQDTDMLRRTLMYTILSPK